MLIVMDIQCKLCVLYLIIQEHGGLCNGVQTLFVNASPGLQTIPCRWLAWGRTQVR